MADRNALMAGYGVEAHLIAAAISAYGMDQVQQAMGETEPQNPLMQGY